MHKEVEMIQIKIPLSHYERQITNLIETILKIDEKLNSVKTAGSHSQEEVA